MAKKINYSNQSGFTLIEIIIAIAIFAVFVAVYITGQGFNLADSTNMKEELLLKTLCENKINEMIITPPELSVGATLKPETKSFESFPDYQHTTEFKQLEIPDLGKVFIPEKEGEEQQQNALQKQILAKVGKSLEKIIWQVKVTVENKETGFNYSLSTWLYKEDEKIDFTSF